MISPYPNSSPGVSSETSRQQEIRTNLTGTEDKTSFSRLLSGELTLARTQRSEAQDKELGSSARKLRSAEQERSRSDLIKNEPENHESKMLHADASAPGSENVSQPELQEAVLSGGTAASWGGIASLIQLGHPVGMAGNTLAGISQTGGMPADMVAGLAADIAAAYSDKNGVQTLTMNLEPDHLGRVEVRLQARGDQLSVRLVAASPEAESAMRENLKDLTEAIQTRTGRYQQVEVRVELKESQEPGKDPADEEPREFQGEGSPKDQDPGTDSENQAGENRDHQVETEPGGPGQGG